MKSAMSRLMVLAVLLAASVISAQDIQELYEEAKQALLDGNCQTALDKIAQARTQIAGDANLDPNGVFKNRLLPKIENTANTMAVMIKALEELNSATQAALVFSDLSPSREAVDQFTLQAKNAGEQLLNQRDRILSGGELDPEFRDALLKTPQYKQIEQLASVGIIEKLSEKLSAVVGTLTDSIKSINQRYNATASSLEKMKKSATAGKAEQDKMEKQLAMLSQERLNYMMTISEMLVGEATEENQQLKMVLTDENIDNVFSNVIVAEIERIRSLTEVDSAGYKELMANYERIKKYNQIFVKNTVTKDQSALLANYEAAIKNVRVVEPGKHKLLIYLAIAVGVVILLFIVLRVRVIFTSKKEKPKSAQPHAPQGGGV
jgi:hypothetical protein